MTTSESPPVPAVLKHRGRDLWAALHERLEYEPHEQQIVLEACRTADHIDELQAVLDEDGFTSTGSTGQTVVHPAVAELRQQQAGLARLLGALNLGAVLEGQAGAVAMQNAVTTAAQAAANARWAKRKGARRA